MKKGPASRVPIPDETAARALFYSNRICCVCHTRKRKVQIHHIDENNSNNVLDNLAVLCFECHSETQTKGGFGRGLDAAQVRLYRDEWWAKVGRNSNERKSEFGESSSTAFVIEGNMSPKKQQSVELQLKSMEANYRLMSLAISHHHKGETGERDKCIDRMLLNKDISVEDELFFRSLQGKAHLVDGEKIQAQLDAWQKQKDWQPLARACSQLGRREDAVKYYCLRCIQALEEGNTFNAGFNLQEMIDKKLVAHLFESALREAKSKDDVWWQIRSLQELGRKDDIDELVLSNRELIEAQGQQTELAYLRAALKRRPATN